MKEADTLPSYAGYRCPREIIAHAVWRYFRFALSYRDVEELLAERGVIVTDETVRQWCRTFGQTYANALRRRRPRPGDKWHLDAGTVKLSLVGGDGGPTVGNDRLMRGSIRSLRARAMAKTGPAWGDFVQ